MGQGTDAFRDVPDFRGTFDNETTYYVMSPCITTAYNFLKDSLSLLGRVVMYLM